MFYISIIMWSEAEVQYVYESHLKDTFKVELKKEQLALLTKVCNKINVLAVLPTGFGKSLIYILAPLVIDKVS